MDEIDKETVYINENSNRLLPGIERLIEQTGKNVAVYLNKTISRLYWSIGNYIITEMQYEYYSRNGQQILATLSRTLTEKFGKGYTCSGLNRMIKVAVAYKEEMFATLSQTLSWSHFIELVSIEDNTGINPDLVFKSTYVLDFLGLSGYFSEKDLEDAILVQLEKFILELGQGFAFLERQKRISIDSADYYLDLLFYHRKYEKQPHENSPIGLLLCSKGNSKHIELLMLDEDNIKVAQYLTTFPDKQWFIDKLNKSIAIAQENVKQLNVK
jgi:predicted nuclease of restriction endonuclease-like (RecB) superfamily